MSKRRLKRALGDTNVRLSASLMNAARRTSDPAPVRVVTHSGPQAGQSGQDLRGPRPGGRTAGPAHAGPLKARLRDALRALRLLRGPGHRGAMLRRTPRRPEVNNRTIIVTNPDALRLRAVLGKYSAASVHNQDHLDDLRGELERAQVVDAGDVPSDVVTVHSRVRVVDLTSGQSSDYTLVFPSDADVASRRISVLAPLGTALLGYREGDEVEWQMPGGLRRLRIEKVQQGADEQAGQPASGSSPHSVGPYAA